MPPSSGRAYNITPQHRLLLNHAPLITADKGVQDAYMGDLAAAGTLFTPERRETRAAADRWTQALLAGFQSVCAGVADFSCPCSPSQVPSSIVQLAATALALTAAAALAAVAHTLRGASEWCQTFSMRY